MIPTLFGTLASSAGYVPETAPIWLDPSDLSSMRQEITGPSATTPVNVGDPVGSLLNKGTVGGWLVAPSNPARPILRQTSGKYYLEATAGAAMQLAFTTAQDNVFIGNRIVLSYGARVTATGTVLGGTGTGTNENLHTGLNGASQITFAFFGNALSSPLSYANTTMVVVGAITASGRYIRYDGAQVASDSSTSLLANGGLKLFTGPLGFGTGTIRIYGMIGRSGIISNTVRNRDEQYLARLTGLSFVST